MEGRDDKEYFIRMWQQQQMMNSGCGTPLYIAVIVFVIMLFSSCATKTVVEYRDRVVDRYITKVEKDTVINHTHDSIYFEVVQKGDTVFATKYKEKYIYLDKIKIKTDTCWRDSIVTITKQTTKEITKIPKLFKVSFVFSILVIIFAFVKLFKWLRIH